MVINFAAGPAKLPEEVSLNRFVKVNTIFSNKGKTFVKQAFKEFPLSLEYCEI